MDLLRVSPEQREKLVRRHRPECATLSHDTHGQFVIRDQKPMSVAGLTKALGGGLGPSDWYELLNRKVFFWPNEKRLHKMMCARAYKKDKHIVLVINTTSLLRSHFNDVLLSRINSGCTVPFPHPRGVDTFLPPDQHPFDSRKKSSGEGFAELLVEYAVPDLIDHALAVYVGNQKDRFETIWSR